MAYRTTLCLTLVLAAQIYITWAQNYFNYDTDCDLPCRSLNYSCVIIREKEDYIKRCTKSAEACTRQATPDSVCLRPNLPAVGGEREWASYKAKFHPNIPKVINDSWLLHVVLVAAGLLTGAFVITGITALCMFFTRPKHYRAFANPSPAHEIDPPYMPTTELLPPV